MAKRRRNKYYDEWVHTADLPLESSDRDTILTWLYKSNIVPWYVTYLMEKTIDNPDVQDYIGEIYLMLAEITQEKWDELFAQGKFAVSGYVTGIIKFQICSMHSKIWTKYAKRAEKEKIMNDEFWTTYDEEE